MDLGLLAATVAPLGFVVALGYLAGRLGVFRPGASAVFSDLAMTFCLPALLFDATARTPLERLTEWRFFLGLCLGLTIVFAGAMVVLVLALRQPLDASTMRAANVAAPDLAAIGLPVMLAVAGKTATLGIVVGNLYLSFALLPVALVCLNAGAGAAAPLGRLIGPALGEALRSPLVWAPLAGIAMAVLRVPLPEVAHAALTLIGDALTGVLLFAMGLFLAERPVRIGWPVPVGLAVKLIVQPAVMAALALALGVSGEGRRQMILLGALPTATVLSLFAIKYGVVEEETEATIVLGAALSVLTLGAIIALTAGG